MNRNVKILAVSAAVLTTGIGFTYGVNFEVERLTKPNAVYATTEENKSSTMDLLNEGEYAFPLTLDVENSYGTSITSDSKVHLAFRANIKDDADGKEKPLFGLIATNVRVISKKGDTYTFAVSEDVHNVVRKAVQLGEVIPVMKKESDNVKGHSVLEENEVVYFINTQSYSSAAYQKKVTKEQADKLAKEQLKAEQAETKAAKSNEEDEKTSTDKVSSVENSNNTTAAKNTTPKETIEYDKGGNVISNPKNDTQKSNTQATEKSNSTNSTKNKSTTQSKEKATDEIPKIGNKTSSQLSVEEQKLIDMYMKEVKGE